jgi:hypothetical protein
MLRRGRQDYLDAYLFGFPDESQKTQFAFGKKVLFSNKLKRSKIEKTTGTGKTANSSGGRILQPGGGFRSPGGREQDHCG